MFLLLRTQTGALRPLRVYWFNLCSKRSRALQFRRSTSAHSVRRPGAPTTPPVCGLGGCAARVWSAETQGANDLQEWGLLEGGGDARVPVRSRRIRQLQYRSSLGFPTRGWASSCQGSIYVCWGLGKCSTMRSSMRRRRSCRSNRSSQGASTPLRACSRLWRLRIGLWRTAGRGVQVHHMPRPLHWVMSTRENRDGEVVVRDSTCFRPPPRSSCSSCDSTAIARTGYTRGSSRRAVSSVATSRSRIVWRSFPGGTLTVARITTNTACDSG